MKKSIIIGIIVGVGILAIGFGTAISSFDGEFLSNKKNIPSVEIDDSQDDSITIKLSENMDFSNP